MTVSVIIVTYNGIQWIDKCLSSLVNSSLPLQIIVIDNGSNDGTQEAAKKYPVHFIQSSENLGFAKANNKGIALGIQQQADYIFLLNQDAWVEKQTIEKLIDVSMANPDYGIISPIHLNGSYTALDIKFANYLIPENCKNILSDLYMDTLKPLYSADFVNAAAWLIPAACIKKVGMFDTSFFFYGEDSNYLQRVQFHGYKTGITTVCTICHDREVRQGKLNISNYHKWQLSQSLVILLNIRRSFASSSVFFFKEQIRLLARHLYEKKFSLMRYPIKQIFYYITHAGKLASARKNYTKNQLS